MNTMTDAVICKCPLCDEPMIVATDGILDCGDNNFARRITYECLNHDETEIGVMVELPVKKGAPQ